MESPGIKTTLKPKSSRSGCRVSEGYTDNIFVNINLGGRVLLSWEVTEIMSINEFIFK